MISKAVLKEILLEQREKIDKNRKENFVIREEMDKIKFKMER